MKNFGVREANAPQGYGDCHWWPQILMISFSEEVTELRFTRPAWQKFGSQQYVESMWNIIAKARNQIYGRVSRDT